MSLENQAPLDDPIIDNPNFDNSSTIPDLVEIDVSGAETLFLRSDYLKFGYEELSEMIKIPQTIEALERLGFTDIL
jgi:hypothetical protein